jgi:hypothetical protein
MLAFSAALHHPKVYVFVSLAVVVLKGLSTGGVFDFAGVDIIRMGC